MRFIRLMILAALVAPGAGSAQPWIAATGASPASGGRTVDDVMRMARTRLMAGDIDRDGRLSREEFIAIRAAAKGDQRDPARAFAGMDRNGDGYLSADEIDSVLARRIARLDANHDGIITRDERQAGYPGAGATRN